MKMTYKFEKNTRTTPIDTLLKQASVRIPTIKLGFFSTATYAKPPYTPVPVVARANDRGYVDGARFIPPRPFLSNLHIKKGKEWSTQFSQLMEQHLATEKSLDKATLLTYQVMATRMQNDLKQAIRDVKTPPNAPSTIKKKGSSNPLIDTGFLRQTATYKLIK